MLLIFRNWNSLKRETTSGYVVKKVDFSIIFLYHGQLYIFLVSRNESPYRSMLLIVTARLFVASARANQIPALLIGRVNPRPFHAIDCTKPRSRGTLPLSVSSKIASFIAQSRVEYALRHQERVLGAKRNTRLTGRVFSLIEPLGESDSEAAGASAKRARAAGCGERAKQDAEPSRPDSPRGYEQNPQEGRTPKPPLTGGHSKKLSLFPRPRKRGNRSSAFLKPKADRNWTTLDGIR